MNVIDIKYKVLLNNNKCKINSIDEINRLTTLILNDAKADGSERYRFWYNKLKNIHPLVDRYMSGQLLSSDISDVTGEHIINTQADTQHVDLKYYYETIRSPSSPTRNILNTIIPLPIRNSVRNKLSNDQLLMTEKSYIKLNKAYSVILSTFFTNNNYNNWTISRELAHSYYNTQDYYGFSIKLLLYDSQMQTLYGKYREKLNLIDSIIPLKESIVIDYDPFFITVEGKSLAIDSMGNKIIYVPNEIDSSALSATPLTEFTL